MENNNNSNSEHNLVHDMEYTYFTHFSKAEIESVIRKTALVKLGDIFFTPIFPIRIIAKFKNEFIVFYSRNQISRKFFYCCLYEIENGTVISGEFKSDWRTKIFFLFLIITDIWLLSSPIFLWNEFKYSEDREDMLIGFYVFSFIFNLILFFLYKGHKSFLKKDKKIILKYIEKVLEAEKVDQR